MGETHEKTKESSEYLKYLTQQAVALQRTMNEIYKNGSNASIMPLKVTCGRRSLLLPVPFLPVGSDAKAVISLPCPSSLLRAWPVSWSSSTLSTASSSYHSGNKQVLNLSRQLYFGIKIVHIVVNVKFLVFKSDPNLLLS